MILVCSHHVTKGLKEISAPHVEEVPIENMECCEFCTEKAKYRLFYFTKLQVATN